MSTARINELLAIGIFAKRRKLLMARVEEIRNKDLAATKASVIIIPSHAQQNRSHDIAFPYRQDSSLYYLTGFHEPDSVAVLVPGRPEGEFILFNLPKDPKKEGSMGKRVGQKDAVEIFGADEAFPIDEFESKLNELAKNREVFFPTYDEHVNAKLKTIVSPFLKTEADDAAHIVEEMRQIKDDTEITDIRKAIDISEAAHLRAMQQCEPGMFEYEVEAELDHEFVRRGARATSYPNIVASGGNGCTLHYMKNNSLINECDLMLIDAGAEYNFYSSDITRTFPASGKFSSEQRTIYNIVLKAQLAGINCVRPGAIWPDIEAAVIEELTLGLLEVGILQGELAELVKTEACKPFYRHTAGHWMGLDVHDAGAYKFSKLLTDASSPGLFKKIEEYVKLAPGMVLTIEPGLYILPTIPGVDPRWHNIAVRIEDDLLVTETGYEILSKKLPKTAVEIETVMAEAKSQRQKQSPLLSRGFHAQAKEITSTTLDTGQETSQIKLY